jgi:methyltransferase-like protein
MAQPVTITGYAKKEPVKTIRSETETLDTKDIVTFYSYYPSPSVTMSDGKKDMIINFRNHQFLTSDKSVISFLRSHQWYKAIDGIHEGVMPKEVIARLEKEHGDLTNMYGVDPEELPT